VLKAIVTMYSRPNCHLCEEAKLAMDAANCPGQYDLEVINIESDPQLLERYKYDIPVVLINGEEAFRHRVNSHDFRKAITKPSG
jgi:glutaredoxin